MQLAYVRCFAAALRAESSVLKRSGVLCTLVLAFGPSASAAGVTTERGSAPIRLNGSPLAMQGTRDTLWVLTCDRGCTGEARRSVGRIVRIDARRGRVVASIKLARPRAFAVGAGGVYATDPWRDTVRRFDLRLQKQLSSLKLVLPFEVAPGDRRFVPSVVRAGRDAVWVSTARGILAGLDARLSGVLETIRIPVKNGDMDVGGRAVWVAVGPPGVDRISPKAKRVVARISVIRRGRQLSAADIVLGGGKVFVVGSWAAGTVLTRDRVLVRMNAARNAVEAVTALPQGAALVTFGRGFLWVARAGGSSMQQIDGLTGRLIRRVPADVGVALAVAGGHLWAADADGTLRPIATP